MIDRVLLHSPVLETREGCRQRVQTMALSLRQRTAWLLGAENATSEELARALHEKNIRRRRRS